MFAFTHNNFNVSNLERSLKFYKEALDLEELRRYEGSDFTQCWLGDHGASKHELELTWNWDEEDILDLGDEFHLAFKTDDDVPYLFDEFYVHGTKGKEVSGLPHKAKIIFKDDGWGELGGGFVAGKHELYPFPFDVIELNRWDESTGTGLKQNPGWE